MRPTNLNSSKPGHWIIAARPVGHGMIAIPLLWGQALALLVTGSFHWSWFVIIQIFGVLCQIYALYLNDYADEALDRSNHNYWLSGGSRVIPNGHLSGQQLYKASFIALLCLVLLAALAFSAGRAWMPAWTGLAIMLAWTYSLSPIKSSYRGYGETHQAISCGALLPLVAFYLQTGTLNDFPWPLLVPICLVFFAGNIITALPDTASDRIGGKLSYPVRHGEKRARRDAWLILLAAYLLVGAASYELSITPSLLISAPSLTLLLVVYQSGLLQPADSADHDRCKRYILLCTLSQLWCMLLWTGLLFWQALQVGQ